MKAKRIKYSLIGLGSVITIAIIPASVVACGSTNNNNNNNNTNNQLSANISALKALNGQISANSNLTLTATAIAAKLPSGSSNLNLLSQYFDTQKIINAATANSAIATYSISVQGNTLVLEINVSLNNETDSTSISIDGFPNQDQINTNILNLLKYSLENTNFTAYSNSIFTPLQISAALANNPITLTLLNTYFDTTTLATLLNNAGISNPSLVLNQISSSDTSNGTIRISIGNLKLGSQSIDNITITVRGFLTQSQIEPRIIAALNWAQFNMTPNPVPQILPSFFDSANFSTYIPTPKPYLGVSFTVVFVGNGDDANGTIQVTLSGTFQGQTIKLKDPVTIKNLYTNADVIKTAAAQITIKSSIDAINTLPSSITTTNIGDTFNTPPDANGFTFSIKYPSSNIADNANGTMNVILVVNQPKVVTPIEQTVTINGFASYTSILNKTLAGITSLSLVTPNSVLLPSFVSNNLSTYIATPSFDNLSGAITSTFSVANATNAVDNIDGTLIVSLNLTISDVTISKTFTIVLTNAQNFLASQLQNVSNQVTPNATGFITLPADIIAAGNNSLSSYVNIPSTITPQGTYIVFNLQLNTMPSSNVPDGSLAVILIATWVSGTNTFVSSVNLTITNFLTSSSSPIDALLKGINSLIDTNNIKAKLSVLFANVNSTTIGNSIIGVPINNKFTYSYQDFTNDATNHTVSFKIGITDNANASSTKSSKLVTLAFPSSMQDAVNQMASAIDVSKIINNSSSGNVYSYYVNNNNVANYITGLLGLDSGFSYTYSVSGNNDVINSALTGQLNLTIGIRNTTGITTTTSTTNVKTTIFNFLEGTINPYDPSDTSIPVSNIDGISNWFNSAIIVPKRGTIAAFKEAAINPRWGINGTNPGWMPGSANLANVLFIWNGKLWGGQPQIAWSYWPDMASTSNDTPKPAGQTFIYVRFYNPNGPGSGSSTTSGWFGIKATGFAS